MISEVRVKVWHPWITTGSFPGQVQGRGSAPAYSQDHKVPAWLVVAGNPACVWKYCCALRCEQCMALAVGLLGSHTLVY